MLRMLLFVILMAGLSGPARSSDQWTGEVGASAGPMVQSGPVAQSQKAGRDKPGKSAGKKQRKRTKTSERKDIPDAMTFVLVRHAHPRCEPVCPEWIMAEGTISVTTPARFRRILKQIGNRKLPVVVHSPGGLVNSAMEVGRLIRKAGLPVFIGRTDYEGCAPAAKCNPPSSPATIFRGRLDVDRAYCNSACPLLLAGGVERMARWDSLVGVHVFRTAKTQEYVRYRETYRIVNGKKRVLSREIVSRSTKSWTEYGIDRRTRRQVAGYLKQMGVSGKLVDEMLKAPFETLHFLSPELLYDLKLVTTSLSPDRHLALIACDGPARALHCIERASPPPTPVAMHEPPPAAPVRGSSDAPVQTIVPMTVTLMRGTGGCEPLCPEWLAAEGDITPDTPRLFRKALDALGGAKVPVVLDSRGGDLDAALEIGRMVRSRGLDTAIAAVMPIGCAPRDPKCSAKRRAELPLTGIVFGSGICGFECLLVFAGGTQRFADEVQNAAIPARTLLSTRRKGETADALLRYYLANMAIDPRLLDDAWRDASRQEWRLADTDAAFDRYRLRTSSGKPQDISRPGACQAIPAPANCVSRGKSM